MSSGLYHPDDTIAAIASAPGAAVRGLIRVSGRAAIAAAQRVVATESWPSTHAKLVVGTVSIAGWPTQPVKAFVWPGSRSFTGEAVVELHLPGIPAFLDAVLTELCQPVLVADQVANDNGTVTASTVTLSSLDDANTVAVSGSGPLPTGRYTVRQAAAGEFTLRAFLSGRIDLTQAEAVLGVIDARDPTELDRALLQLAGGVASDLQAARSELLDILADLEAGLDFSDEDLDFVGAETLAVRLAAVCDRIRAVQSAAPQRMLNSARLRVVLAGKPNAGKSTLFNALLNRPAAIVSDVPGTTRDVLTAELTLGGMDVELVDTAGETLNVLDDIDRDAQSQRANELANSDLLLWCIASDDESPVVQPGGARGLWLRVITKADLPMSPAVAAVCSLSDAATARLMSERLMSERLMSERLMNERLTVAHSNAASSTTTKAVHPVTTLHVAAADAPQLAAFRDRLQHEVCNQLPESRRSMLGSTAARCATALAGSVESLTRAVEVATREADQDLLAFELREALSHLSEIVGAVYTDDVLDRIFSRFCIGK